MGNQTVTSCCLQRAFNVFRLLRVKETVYEYHFVEQIADATAYQPVEVGHAFFPRGQQQQTWAMGRGQWAMRAMLKYLCPDLSIDAPTDFAFDYVQRYSNKPCGFLFVFRNPQNKVELYLWGWVSVFRERVPPSNDS